MGNNNRTDMRDDPTTTEDVESDADGGGAAAGGAGGGTQTTQEEASQENNWPLVLWFEAQGLVRSPATGEGRVNVRVSRALLASSSPDTSADSHKIFVEVSTGVVSNAVSFLVAKIAMITVYSHIIKPTNSLTLERKNTDTPAHPNTQYNHTMPHKSPLGVNSLLFLNAY